MSLPIHATDEQRRLVRVGRMWAIGGLAWTVVYLGLYVFLIVRSGNPIAWAYVGNLLLAIALIGWSFVVPSSRTLLLIAVAALAIAMAIGLISIGILLGPAVILTAYASRRAFHPLSSGWRDR